IIEIQTDNDAAFTDKFISHGLGVTGKHDLDLWCTKRGIIHRLIPVGVKELNGKVENTHKQDDREFFAVNDFRTFEQIELGTRGYSERWNNQRSTRALGWKTPAQVLADAFVRAYALLLFMTKERNNAVYHFDSQGDVVGFAVPKPKKQR